MFMRTLLGCLILLGPLLKAHALPTENVPSSVLKSLGTELADNASNSQWQQLWQRTRHAGHLGSGAQTVHFTVPQAQIPALVAQTLTNADEAGPLKQTQVRYRRDFHPRVIGKAATGELSAVCVWVDWRSFPTQAINRPAGHLQQVSLLLARPCD
ncbi:hypothetical protein EXN22_10885 [Pseudomonas tructae]|uniref:Uncharacterized protein n=1 Tax=Pseudomonas tructae TaxID=2518644 RepID=A0A411MHL1_9PSED|nr:hypothetical protein [Pseudomonas tructae]QBF26174.1 hypothetical protein EXN22_10885 [Pseudomonas tructae]